MVNENRVHTYFHTTNDDRHTVNSSSTEHTNISVDVCDGLM